MSKKIFIDTLGCAKNEYDSEVLAASLTELGCQMTDDPEDADILIVNTCGFIEDAKVESINHIFDMANLKGEEKKLIVTGCLSQRYHDELEKELPEVDLFAGVNEYDRLSKIVAAVGDDEAAKFSQSDIVGDEVEKVLPYKKRIIPEGTHSAVLKIAEGCSNSCAFCAIPKIRGPYRSKKMEDVVLEAENLAAQGVKELVVIAQDTSVYGRDLYGSLKLPELLHKLCRVEGIEWIRLMYVYDNNITPELLDTIAEEPKVCNYLDIPIQHIADNVLSRMRRRSTSESIRNTIRMIRERIPDMCIRTTLLVGFPGETENDFQELLDFVKEAKFDRLGAFSYSDEEGTISHGMDGKLDKDTKEARLDAVMREQADISFDKNQQRIGHVMDVMIDEVDGGIDDSDDEDLIAYVGRTRFDAPDVDCEVEFTSTEEHEPGDIVKVMIEDAAEYDLNGREIL